MKVQVQLNRFPKASLTEEKKNLHCLQMSHCLEMPDGAKLITSKKFAFEMLLQQALKKI